MSFFQLLTNFCRSSLPPTWMLLKKIWGTELRPVSSFTLALSSGCLPTSTSHTGTPRRPRVALACTQCGQPWMEYTVTRPRGLLSNSPICSDDRKITRQRGKEKLAELQSFPVKLFHMQHIYTKQTPTSLPHSAIGYSWCFTQHILIMLGPYSAWSIVDTLFGMIALFWVRVCKSWTFTHVSTCKFMCIQMRFILCIQTWNTSLFLHVKGRFQSLENQSFSDLV